MLVTYQVPGKKLGGGALKVEIGPLDGEEVLLALSAGSMTGGRRTLNSCDVQGLSEEDAEANVGGSR